MNPRDLIQRPLAICRRTLVPALVILTAALTLAVPVRATVRGVSVSPAAPTACDSVTLAMQGTFTNTCQQIVDGQSFGPEPIPEWAGPLPAYRTLLVLTVQQTPGDVCGQAAPTYRREFPMSLLPIGLHFVTAVERFVDGNGALIDSSTANLSFTVAGADTCWPCVLLGFRATPPGNPIGCEAAAPPGGTGCFYLWMGNNIPVGGAQFRVQILNDQGQPLSAGSFTPVSVTGAGRVANTSLQWTANGSAAEVILYSLGSGIPQGQGEIVRVCYAVGPNVPNGVYTIVYEKSLVADVDGRDVGLCPTFRMVSGQFCVGPSPGCDVNGDGIATITDIVGIARCALAGSACPNDVAQRSDCNVDGTVDVRDVICCVRKLLLVEEHWIYPPSDYSAPHTSIGFSGAARWVSPLSGDAMIAVTPVSAFGGAMFDVSAPSGIRITNLDLSESPGYRLEWSERRGGTVRALLLRDGSSPVQPAQITVGFERTGTGDLAGTSLRIGSASGSTWDAVATIVETPVDRAPLAGQAIAAPAVYRARPNPFSGTSEIAFALPADGRVSLRIFDAAGRLVRTLVDGVREGGVSRVSWDGKDGAGRAVRSGIYFVKLNAAGVERTSRIVKLR